MGKQTLFLLIIHSPMFLIFNLGSSLIPALNDDGYLVLQTFYQKSVLDSGLIENYNHEHLTYSFVRPLADFFHKYGFKYHLLDLLMQKEAQFVSSLKTTKPIELDTTTKDLLLAEKSYLNDPILAFKS